MEADPNELDVLAQQAVAAARAWSLTTPRHRADVLLKLASALESASNELVEIASEETGLTEARLRGELTRTVVQARLFADVVRRGEFLDVRIDEHDDKFVLGVRPDLRRYLVALGPVLNFAASNFPFAFSVFGGDTVSALAAGCSVIVKLHSGHPRLGLRTTEIVQAALGEVGVDPGVLQSILGQDAGVALLKDSRIKAAAFTGSTSVGRYLADIAAARPEPIPFYGELGSVNPTFVLAGAIEENGPTLAAGLVASVSGSAGQLCTKPGFIFVPRGVAWDSTLREAIGESEPHRLLTPSISRAYGESAKSAREFDQTTVVLAGGERKDGDLLWATPTLVRMSAAQLVQHPHLAEETFGPFAVLVEYDSITEAIEVATALFPGNLTCTIHAGTGDSESAVSALIDWATAHAGRVIYGGWPTGVAVTAAQQHGGPWPATTDARSTSVGTAAIGRFLRPVAFQSVPEKYLPEPLQDANPWGVPQLRNADGRSLDWGKS